MLPIHTLIVKFWNIVARWQRKWRKCKVSKVMIQQEQMIKMKIMITATHGDL